MFPLISFSEQEALKMPNAECRVSNSNEPPDIGCYEGNYADKN